LIASIPPKKIEKFSDPYKYEADGDAEGTMEEASVPPGGVDTTHEEIV